MFDYSARCPPWNLGIPFLPQWPLRMHLPMFFVDWQLLILTQDTFFGMHPILHIVHHTPMTPPEIGFALRPFPFIAPH
jgi:hypothetical protein